MKRKRTIDIIEQTPNPKIEHSFIKYPGREAKDITDYSRSTTTSVWADGEKMMSQCGARPAEWGLQEVPAVLRDSFPWDKREMRKFLNRERETPPMSNWERAEKGLPLQDT